MFFGKVTLGGFKTLISENSQVKNLEFQGWAKTL